MAVPPDTVKAGKYYLMVRGDVHYVRYVAYVELNERVHYLGRTAKRHWQPGIQERRYFALTAEREVPWDWAPDAEA